MCLVELQFQGIVERRGNVCVHQGGDGYAVVAEKVNVFAAVEIGREDG